MRHRAQRRASLAWPALGFGPRYSAADMRPRFLLLLAYLAFVSLGLPDTVLGIAWPSLRSRFELPPAALGSVLVCGMAGYFLSGLVAGRCMTRLGVGGLLAASSALVTCGLVGYSLAPSWRLFFPVAVVVGLGSGAIDAALNGYAARHFSVRHVNWLHACWGIGASTGPVIMTFAIARGAGYADGYAALALLLAVMTLAFLRTRRAWNDPSSAPATSESLPRPQLGLIAALQSRRVWLLVAAFFLYTGLESTVGQWCFTWLRERRGLAVPAAGAWTSAYWASLTLGRIALGSVADRVGPDRLLRVAALGAVGGVLIFSLHPGALGRAGLLLLGTSLAPIYPTLMARMPARVGSELANHTVGLLVSAATLGSAFVPALTGLLVGRSGLIAIAAVAITASALLFALHEAILRARSEHPT